MVFLLTLLWCTTEYETFLQILAEHTDVDAEEKIV